MRDKDYIPRNTRNVKAIERLKRLPFQSVRQDVPMLLEWLQDGHWEVAEGIAKYLIPHVSEITDELLFVLNTDDSTWKYHLIYILIAQSKEKLNPPLIEALRMIAEQPSNIDAEDYVDEAAKNIIANKALCG